MYKLDIGTGLLTYYVYFLKMSIFFKDEVLSNYYVGIP